MIYNDEVVAYMRNMALIEHYNGRNLAPPVQCLQAVKHLSLTCIDAYMPDELAHYMPQLKALEKLELNLRQLEKEYDTSDEYTERDVRMGLVRLVRTLPSTLTELRILGDIGSSEEGCKYDLRLGLLLEALPATVTLIEYLGYTVRRLQ
jgi:hypothetical protein